MVEHSQNYKIRVILIAVFSLAFITGLGLLLNKQEIDLPQVENQQSTTKTPFQPTTDPEPVPAPAELRLKVPFTPQAPTANWDELHNEACEEASIIMAWAYFNNITPLSTAQVETEIDKLTNWQQENYGYYLSITTPETARVAEEVYGLSAEVTSFNTDTIKQALAENRLVIIPAQGQLLENPNFKPPGPPYHMLVITGYYNKGDVDYFTTNDPGTRRGENYEYTFETIELATGNYSHTTKQVNTGDKDMIIISN